MSTPRSTPATDVIVAFASRHGATCGVAERIAARLHGGRIEVALSSIEDAGGRLGDNRDRAAIDAWAESIARALEHRTEPAGAH